MKILQINADHSEVVPYRKRDFPVLTEDLWLSSYLNHSFLSHWHDDLEFTLVDQGTMRYLVEGETFLLQKGEGLLVNSRRLHGGDAIDHQDCHYHCILFEPSLVLDHPRIPKKLVEAVTGNGMPNAVLLRASVPWQREIMDLLRQIHEELTQWDDGCELGALSGIYGIWRLLCQHLESAEANAPLDGKRDMLHQMIGFIQDAYSGPVTLADIAGVANISKSYCCALFQELLHETPVSYLNTYRMERSIEMLVGTKLSITEIASLCGFSSLSYYTAQFREKMGMTPKEYRKQRAS